MLASILSESRLQHPQVTLSHFGCNLMGGLQFVQASSYVYTGVEYDPDANAYIAAINAAGCNLTQSECSAVSGFFLAAKGSGVPPYGQHAPYWSDMLMFNLVIGDGGTTAHNLSGATVQYLFSGGAWAPITGVNHGLNPSSSTTGTDYYSVGSGFVFGGNSKYVDTLLNPTSAALGYNISGFGLWGYFNNAQSTRTIIGTSVSTSVSQALLPMALSGTNAAFGMGGISDNVNVTWATGTNGGFIGLYTTGLSATYRISYDGNDFAAFAAGTGGFAPYDFWVGTLNEAGSVGFSAHGNVSFYAISSGMPSGYTAYLYQDVLAFQTLLGRN